MASEYRPILKTKTRLVYTKRRKTSLIRNITDKANHQDVTKMEITTMDGTVRNGNRTIRKASETTMTRNANHDGENTFIAARYVAEKHIKKPIDL